MFEPIWILLQVLIGYNLVLPLVLYLFYLLRKKRHLPTTPPAETPDYGIIVTAYEQTDSLPQVVSSLLALNYDRYVIYVVADKCDISNLNFTDERVVLLRPESTLASNTKSHFYAINRFIRPHDHLVIIDSDNLVHPELLHQLNIYFLAGYQAVQGRRDAKNLDTTYACLDAARDIYYHFYDGEVLFRAGSSATLSGSGMAFTTALYRKCLENKPVEGAGFDKVLQASIVERNLRIAFSGEAIVYDEKTSQSGQLVQQRSRWINTWFKYFKFGFHLIGKGVKSGNWNQFLFGVILLRPPLFLFLIAGVFCTLANLWINPTASAVWLAAFVLFVVGFLIPFRYHETDPRILKALLSIPKFVFFQIKSLFKVRRANQNSVATRHFHTQAESPLKNTP